MLSRDLMFFTAVEGLARRMGHSARQVESLSETVGAELLVADFVSAPQEVAALARGRAPSSVAIFTPHERMDVFREARALGIAVYRRGALLEELPHILERHSVGSASEPGGGM